jgi:hypothetical protein
MMKSLITTLLGALIIGATSTLWGFSADISSLKRTVYFLETEIKEIKGNQKEILGHILEMKSK